MTRARSVVVVGLLLVLAGCASGAPASTSEISERVEGTGIAPELVRVVDLDGFDLITQAVGVWGSDGMSALYLAESGGSVMLGSDRVADPTAVPCAELPDAPAEEVRCAVEHDGAQVLLEATGVEPAVLRGAAESVHVPSPGELSALFADLPPMPDAPVERGDLPEGDGAPNNDVGEGG